MHVFDQRFLGIAVVCLLGALVLVKRFATGSVLDKPQGNRMVQLVNIFNLFFLLVVNPVAGIALIARALEVIDPTHVVLRQPLLLIALEIAGFMMYVTGFLVMMWALITLGRSYQLGGSAPRSDDKMVMAGPYALIRHPMYAAALSIALGLACLVQSAGFFAVFCIYLVLILFLIPMEEQRLDDAYDQAYLAYQKRVRKLIPFVY